MSGRADRGDEAPGRGWTSIHASAVVVGEVGVVIRGPSDSGKSALALALLAVARERRLFAALIGDDRVSIAIEAGRVLARGCAA